METKTTYPYEEAAEFRNNVQGWVCRACGRFYGSVSLNTQAEHLARWCCAKSLPCECGGRHQKPYTCCETCRAKLKDERYAAREKRPWDGVQMLYSLVEDRWFANPDEIDDWIEDGQMQAEEDSPTTRDNLRIVLSEPAKPPCFDMNDFLCDILPEEESVNAEDIEDIVNDWIREHGVFSWYPNKYAWDGTARAAQGEDPT